MQLSRTSTLLFQFGLVLVVTVAAGCGDSSILERAMGVDRSGSSGVHGQVAGGVPDANLAVASSAAEVIVQLAEGVDPDAFSGEYGSEVLRSIPELNLFVLAIPSAASSAGFLDVLNEDPSVTFAETNAVALAVEGLQGSMAFDEGLHDWQGVLDQDVLRRLRVSDAQAVSRGSGVIVAILDTGIDLDHAALAAHLLLPGVEFGVPHLPGDDRPQ